ncbi:CubicO group peptidase, beta-lactamase class C family [Spirosomataceae bacterium TFI 002]|nr:CubicO group peptidase, beta-lactamase class C family [Spirosomataceae bacterium TFI 002]
MKKATIVILTLICFSCTEKATEIIKNPVFDKQKDIEAIDLMVNNFLAKYNLPGASVAITKNEKLVYTKGYGYANVEKKELVTPEHVFRIASCTKPYTGMAIMKLVELNALKLSDKVFGPGAILGTKYGTKAYSHELKQITVSHLLQNVSGAFVDANGRDLINSMEQLNNKDYMNWVLDNSTQEFSPGTKYHYVNVNFFVASMIIEELAGRDYDGFLQEVILRQITDGYTRLGKNSPSAGEVTYYGQGVLKGQEYGNYFERYFGAGSLLGNAESLVRFATALDGKNTRPDLLSPSLMKEYTTGSAAASSQAHGIGLWGNDRYYFYGSLPGSRSGWIVDKSTGLSAAIVFNGNLDYTKANYNDFALAVQDVLVDFVTQQRAYQDIDQFYQNVF